LLLFRADALLNLAAGCLDEQANYLWGLENKVKKCLQCSQGVLQSVMHKSLASEALGVCYKKSISWFHLDLVNHLEGARGILTSPWE
jgi:hypothetical protein